MYKYDILYNGLEHLRVLVSLCVWGVLEPISLDTEEGL